MKFTNQTLGVLISLFIISVSNYFCYKFYPNEDLIITAAIVDLVFTVIFLIALFSDEWYFEYHIPNPFASIADSYKQKRKYLSELDNILIKISETESNEDLDLLIRKKDIIEQHLGL